MKALREQLERYMQSKDVPIPDVVDFSPFQRTVECATCNDTGFVVVGNWNPDRTHYSEQNVTCPNPGCPTVQRNLELRYQKLVARGKLPDEYRDYQFEDWRRLAKRENAKVTGKWLGLGAARAFVDNAANGYWFYLEDAYRIVNVNAEPPNAFRKNSIVLAGRPGVGKTSLAACIVNALRAEQIPALYERVSNILDALREPFNGNKAEREFDYGESEQQILRTFSHAPVLVMDEFNLAKASDYSRQRLEDIVRHRMAHHLPTVMTTNLIDFEDFNEHWGERVGHAVQGMAHWIVMSGAELRKRGGPVESV